jgi:hypothetical protein
MNYILGSGVTGLLARMILGDKWTIIPFHRSRFFSYNPAIDDNFIISNERIDPYLKDLGADVVDRRFFYQRAWSIGGQLYKGYDSGLNNDWHYKIFGPNVPGQSPAVYKDKMVLPIYDLKINNVYKHLLETYQEEIIRESQEGIPTKITKDYIERNGKRLEYDNIVSTIPLYALFKLMNLEYDLKSKQLYYYHIETPDLDFEGANQVLVVDPTISFFKATNINKNRYLFYCHEELPNPGAYFMTMMNKFEILDGTTVERALPMGARPNLTNLEKVGIHCVGSYAEWDWCMDVGSCIMRLLDLSQRGFKPKPRNDITLPRI